VCENQTVLEERFVKMSYFALDFEREIPYPPAPPQGWEGSWIFDNLAASKWQLAISQT